MHDLELLSLCEECCDIDQHMKGIFFWGRIGFVKLDGVELFGPVVVELELHPMNTLTCGHSYTECEEHALGIWKV